MSRISISQPNPLSIRSRIYQTLYTSKDLCTKQSLSRSCQISMPTVYQNLSDLMHDGLVCYSDKAQSTGGRRAMELDIVPDARISVGISVTEHQLRIAAADLRLRELAYQTVPFDTPGAFSGDSVSIADILSRFLDCNALDRSRILGVGIAIPGLISPDQSRIVYAPSLNLKDMPLENLIRNIPFPVHIVNDATASGHAECFVRDSSKSMAYLSLENGVGGAVLMKGQLYEGENARSGEFGHICVEPGGLRCTCGSNGCLEPYCSPKRIEQTFGITLDAFFQGVEAHNPEYEKLLYNMLRHLASAINSIRMTLDCDVVLGGFFSEYLQPYLPVLKQYVTAANPFSEPADFVQLSKLRRHITPLGAALYFIRSFIESV